MATPEPFVDPIFIKSDTFHSRAVAEGQLSPSHMIVCPFCGFDYNHLQRPARLLGWESADNGVRAAYHWTGRGDGVALPVYGECGHSWVLCLAFHKGQLFMFAVGQTEGNADDDRDLIGHPTRPDWLLRLDLADSEGGVDESVLLAVRVTATTIAKRLNLPADTVARVLCELRAWELREEDL